MINTPTYEVNLYLNGSLIGDVREIAQNLTWVRRRTKVGADEIDFTLNDVLFGRWLEERNATLAEVLKPMALECRITRNAVSLVGGFLATMPGYSPRGTSADLSMRFDGFLNLLGGVNIYPIGTVTGNANALVQQFINEANTRSGNNGKSYGFVSGEIRGLPVIQHTFDNFQTVKDWICNRCDNVTGAGQFDLYFHADKVYDVIPDASFGDIITDWIAYYPAMPNSPSAMSISAEEVQGFSSCVIGIGSGEISSKADENTAITSRAVDQNVVGEYGYYETIYQNSSVSDQALLNSQTQTELFKASNPQWQPQITLTGAQVSPIPSGDTKIWLGDTITIQNEEDMTGMTNGAFRVNELSVAVSAAGGETITPVLERVL